MDIPVCFTLVHKGCGITPPIYSALLWGVWYWCTRGSRWCVLCRTLGNNLPRFALPYQIAPASLASSWAGRHCLSHADSTLKCCQGMLSHLLSPTTSPKRGCLLKHPCLPSSSKNPAVPVPHIFCSCLNPPAQKLWCLEVPIPPSASRPLQMVASSPSHALRNKTGFQRRYRFPDQIHQNWLEGGDTNHRRAKTSLIVRWTEWQITFWGRVRVHQIH